MGSIKVRSGSGTCGSPGDRAQAPVLVATHPRPERFVQIEGAPTELGTREPILPADGEAPVRRIRLKAYWIDPFTVTNGWFSRFLGETCYETDAERYGCSLVFYRFLGDHPQGTLGVDGAEWWRRIEGADWAHPEGPASSIDARLDHPVTHISWNDANAFARWAGGRLPTEAEWEHAARGGLPSARFPWGDLEPDDGNNIFCNIWQGRFPHDNTQADGFAGTAPVMAFEPNGYGIYNMSGNVWEWCADPFRVHSLRRSAKALNDAALAEKRKVAKGGSYLCHRSYCYRYRIASRIGTSPDTSAGHTGFRVVFDD